MNPSQGGMYNLSTLIKRLEAATSRLEDIAQSASPFDSHHGERSDHGDLAMPNVAVPTSSSAPNLPTMSAEPSQMPSPQPPAASLPPAIEAMDELLDHDVKLFVEASRGIDPLVEEQAEAVAKAFADQRRFILTTTRAKKPDMNSQTFNEILKDLQHDIGTVGDIRDNARGSAMKDHLAMIGEGIGSIQWLLMDGKPADFVGDTIGGAQLYGNRVLRAYKETDARHVKFVQSFYGLLKALQAYIKKFYPSGITWNNQGIDAGQAFREAGASSTPAAPTTNGTPAPSGGAPPPPPPPPPLPTFDLAAGPSAPPPPGSAPKSTAAAGDMGAVFEQLNRGSAVTAGLKKVDKSQMTHKNPALRASGVVPDNSVSRSKSPGPDVKPKPPSMRQNSTSSTPTQKAHSNTPSATSKPEPKKELDGNKWLIENWDTPSVPLEITVTLTQSLLITNCKSTTIILHGKANAISISNSPRLQLLVETLVSSIDVIKSSNFAVQVTGTLPTILLDQVDGAQIYLGKESLATEVFTSKSSSVNIVLPPGEDAGEEDGDGKEVAVPEQIRTFVKDGKVVSEIVEHAG